MRSVLGEASPRALDALSSLGERMSVHLLAGALRARGTPALPVDASEIVRTDETFQAAAPDMPETRRLTQEMLSPLLAQGIVPVITGFVGATEDGVVTTLGRGGSDYSAAIIGAALDADEVWIYTDVDGVMTADPRVVPDVRTLETLSYREMSELAYFGAKVLHPKTVLPALERGIPIRIRNTFNPTHPGHAGGRQVGRSRRRAQGRHGRPPPEPHHDRRSRHAGRARHRRAGLRQRRADGHQRVDDLAGLLRAEHLLPRAAALRGSVVDALRREFEHELARRDIESVWALDEAVIVTVVGSAIQRMHGIAGRVFGALGDAHVNVIAIAMGSSECSISLVVEARDAEAAVRCLHTLM
jgi:bifunctional aspartokinase / homoserine dehydrogenase 1